MGCPEDLLPLFPQPTAIPDKCEGDGCKCPPGLVGIQPFCRQPEPVTGMLQINDEKKTNEHVNNFGQLIDASYHTFYNLNNLYKLYERCNRTALC